MTETKETSFDGYVSSTDRCRDLFGSEGPCRCDNCEKFRKDKGLGDFICRHMRGYKEAPCHIKDVLIVNIGDQIMGLLVIFGANTINFTKISGIKAKDGSVL